MYWVLAPVKGSCAVCTVMSLGPGLDVIAVCFLSGGLFREGRGDIPG